MKYKLIAIDIDGTLLNNQKEILNQTKIDIKSAYEKGVIITICTGRGYPAAKRYIDELDLNIPLILYNGSRVRMSKDDTLLLNNTIDSKVAQKVYNLIEEHNGTCCFWSNDKLFFNKNNHYTIYYENLTTIKPNIIDKSHDGLFNQINKFIWFDESDVLVDVQNNVLNNVMGINYFKSQSELLEIVPSNVSKGLTLEKLASLLGVKQEEVIAIGDDENDISMIKYAGLGIAMGNAKETVKQVADYITLTNEENGVGEAIKKFIL